MNSSKLKILGILIMILSHPFGLWFGADVLPKIPLYAERLVGIVSPTVITMVGMLELFLLGLALFALGMIRSHQEQKVTGTEQADTV